MLDLTPSWDAVAESCIMILENAEDSERGRKAQDFARKELVRMGEIIEHLMKEREQHKAEMEALVAKLEKLSYIEV